MDYLKYNLTPLDEAKGAEPKTEAEKAAREELKRHRQETQRYKQKYFEYYDDVKINHREDWWLFPHSQKAHHTVRFFQMKFRKNIDLAIVICVAMFVHRT